MSTTGPPVAPPPAGDLPRSPAKRPSSGHASDLLDWAFKHLCQGAGLLVVFLFIILIVVLVQQALPAMRTLGLPFLYTDAWQPDLDDQPAQGKLGALAFVYGTVVTSLIAMLLALPLGLGTAAFLSEIATPLVRRVGAFLIELLAAIPSVVYGFWGIFFLAPLVQKVFIWLVQVFPWLGSSNVDGKGVFCAGVILAIMIVPYITAISFDVCQAVPRSQREGSLAMGSTRWQMIWTVILPYARPGIIGGCILALGRALGETMAVVMLIGNQKEHIDPTLTAKGATVASVIASELNTTLSSLKRSALVEMGLILMLVTIVVNGAAALLIHRLGRPRNGGLFSWLRRPQRPSGPSVQGPFDFRRYSKRAHRIDRLMTVVLGAALVVTCVPLFLILGYISFQGASSLSWTFFTNTPFDEPMGLGQAVLGTVVLVLMSSAWAVPIGVLAAIFLVEYRKHRLVPAVRFINELLAGVPSIIIGVLGYGLLVKGLQFGSFKLPALGFSGWAGAFALGVLMIPVVMRSAEESLKLVPQSLRNASFALGGAYWQTVLRVTLPAALAPIITGILLAMARIAGETAPLLLTAGTRDRWTVDPNGSMPYLTYFIYNWSMEAGAETRRLAWGGAFVLLALVMAMNVGVRLLAGKRAVSATRAD